MSCLEGIQVGPLTAAKVKKLIGKKVKYLRECDIDRSGRGYFFPRTGIVLGSYGRNLEMDHEGNYFYFSSFKEMVVLEE